MNRTANRIVSAREEVDETNYLVIILADKSPTVSKVSHCVLPFEMVRRW
jgi:hypothetical protein